MRQRVAGVLKTLEGLGVSGISRGLRGFSTHGNGQRQYGQPTPETHGHLLRPGQITPGIPASEYAERRKQALRGVRESDVILLFSGPTKYMSHNIFYRFRADVNFWYLTGFEECDSAAALHFENGEPRLSMFSRKQTEYSELWDGYLTGPEGTREKFGADASYEIGHLAEWLRGKMARRNATLHLDFGSMTGVPGANTRYMELMGMAGPNGELRQAVEYILHEVPAYQMGNIRPFLERMRSVKSENEVNVLRRACLVTAYAHAKLMASETQSELEMEALFNYECKRHGSVRPAYEPVVAGGDSALSLHYTENNRMVDPSRLVLVDAGCEWGGYASDLSRTFPMGRRETFTEPERDLMHVVYESHQACMRACRAGESREYLHNVALQAILRGLRQINWHATSGDLRQLFPHGVSHFVGIDLHDCRSLSYMTRLQEGMVLTIEPGIYVRPGIPAPKGYENIGIRLEDMVVVGKGACENLTGYAPVTVDGIEAVKRSRHVDVPAELRDWRI